MQLSGSLDASTAGAAAGAGAAAKLAAVLRERPYCQQLPAEERGSPLGVALVALAGGLSRLAGWRERRWRAEERLLFLRQPAAQPQHLQLLSCAHAWMRAGTQPGLTPPATQAH